MVRPLNRPLAVSLLAIGCTLALHAFAQSSESSSSSSSVPPSSSSLSSSLSSSPSSSSSSATPTSSTSSASSRSSTSSIPTGTATLNVIQKPLDGLMGQWNLLSQQDVTREGFKENEILERLPAGNYTFFAKAPDGAIPLLRLYRGDERIASVDRSQVNFTLADGEHLRMEVEFLFNRVGLVSVQSDPPGVEFTMTGPNNKTYKGITPMSFDDTPEGQYKVQYAGLKGCVIPPPKSLYLEKNKRLSFSIVLECEGAQELREEQTTGLDSRFVSVTIDGEKIVFEDVPQEAWFAPFVFNAARKGVLSGYRGDDGKPTGKFGPGNNVTVAELAKIAHRAAGIDETLTRRDPLNPDALDAWFAPFIASAEELGWTIYADATVNPLRDATRGEVLVTLLQALNVPMTWQQGGVFTDVTRRTPFSAAIETAAAFEIVSGKESANGQATGEFGPLDPVNRAELSKIIDLAVLTLRKDDASSSASSRR